MQKFTPGPWRIAGTGTIRDAKGWIGSVHWRNRDANARLISAAPELYEALQAALPLLETVEAKTLIGDEGCLWAVEIARAALAKATGA